jgi:hypothetical protein
VIAPGAEGPPESPYGPGAIAFTIVGMLVVAYLAWRLVQRQERGDADLEAKLRADDERAARGRREESQPEESR